MLTSSERDLNAAKLLHDFLLFSVESDEGRRCPTARLDDICDRILAGASPSSELIATSLAALELAAKDERLRRIPGLRDKLAWAIETLLTHCIQMMSDECSLPADKLDEPGRRAAP